MIDFLMSSALLSYRQPREGLRRVLGVIEGLQPAMLIWALAVVISCFGVALGWVLFGPPEFAGLPDGAPAPTLQVRLVATVLGSMVEFAFLSCFIFGVGRLFGGAASFPNVVAAIAWLSLLTAPFAPLLGVTLDPAAPLMGVKAHQLGIMLFVTWMLVCFVAEVHKFRSAWRVAAFLVGAVVFFAFLSLLMTPGGV